MDGSGGQCEEVEPLCASDNGSCDENGGPYHRDQNIFPILSTSHVDHVTSDPGGVQHGGQDMQDSMLLGAKATTVVTDPMKTATTMVTVVPTTVVTTSTFKTKKS
jgi:hypothetical protein